MFKKKNPSDTPVIRRGYKYRIEPNKTQVKILECWLETHRYYYNRALEPCRRAWDESTKESRILIPSQIDLCKAMAIYRRDDPYGLDLNQNSIQHTIKRMRDSWDILFKKMKENREVDGKRYGVCGFGVPHFHRRGDVHTITFTYPGQGVKLIDYPDAKSKLRLTGLDLVKIRMHRPIPVGSEIKQVQITEEAGKWYAVFSLIIPTVLFKEEVPDTDVGLDMGLKSFIVSSDGKIDLSCTKFLRQKLSRLRQLDQACSRRAIKDKDNKLHGPQTAGYKRAVIQKRNLNVTIKNQREHWHNNIAKNLADNYGTVYVEDLNIKSMMKKPKPKIDPITGKYLPNGAAAKTGLAKSIADAGWGKCLLRCKSTLERRGRVMMSVNARGTTQTCSGCGGKPAVPIKLSVRTYRCEHCGLVMDRDLNAAKNVLSRGRILKQKMEQKMEE